MDSELISISFIVACFEHLHRLPIILWSLRNQTSSDIEVIVADNSINPAAAFTNRRWVSRTDDPRFSYLNLRLENCYLAAMAAAKSAQGEYLCFPDDDGYYVPGFAEIMLRTAREEPVADFVYSDVLFDPRWKDQHCRPNRSQQCDLHSGTWTHYSALPEIGCISKGGFLIRRSLFLKIGFPGPELAIQSDALLTYAVTRSGVVTRKAPGILWVHN